MRTLIYEWAGGRSASSIAGLVGRSRNAVMGKARRLGLRDGSLIIAARPGRDGQGAFRKSVLRAYENRCAISSTSEPLLIEAAHIVPYAKGGRMGVDNGLALRVDLHAMFDLGLLGISSALRVSLASSVSDPDYTRFDDQTLRLPADKSVWPSRANLRWHHENVFADKVAQDFRPET